MVIKKNALEFKIVDIGDKTSMPRKYCDSNRWNSVLWKITLKTANFFEPYTRTPRPSEAAQKFPGWRLPTRTDVDTFNRVFRRKGPGRKRIKGWRLFRF